MTDRDAPDPTEAPAIPPGDANRDRIMRMIMARCSDVLTDADLLELSAPDPDMLIPMARGRGLKSRGGRAASTLRRAIFNARFFRKFGVDNDGCPVGSTSRHPFHSERPSHVRHVSDPTRGPRTPHAPQSCRGVEADTFARLTRHDERDAAPVGRRPPRMGCLVGQDHVTLLWAGLAKAITSPARLSFSRYAGRFLSIRPDTRARELTGDQLW